MEDNKCPKCQSIYSYPDRNMQICSECTHEWIVGEAKVDTEIARVYKDANGVKLENGDTVTVIKDLKIGGSSGVVKVGTKVKNIRLVDSDHDIDCTIKGIGAMKLKTQFVKKVN